MGGGALGQRLIIITRPAPGRTGVYCGDGRRPLSLGTAELQGQAGRMCLAELDGIH